MTIGFIPDGLISISKPEILGKYNSFYCSKIFNEEKELLKL